MNNLKQKLIQWSNAPENSKCADCNREKPTWASVSIGVFICMDCAGIHRAMGTHISKVRSIQLDSWTNNMIQFMFGWGNLKANKFWECNLPFNQKLRSSATMNERNSFIRQKYERRAYYGQPSEITPQIEQKTSNQKPSNAVLAARERYLALKAGKPIIKRDNITAQPVKVAVEVEDEKPSANIVLDNTTDLFSGLQVSNNNNDNNNNNNNPIVASTTQEERISISSDYTKELHESLGFKKRDPRVQGASPWVKKSNHPPSKKTNVVVNNNSVKFENIIEVDSNLFGGLEVKASPNNNNFEIIDNNNNNNNNEKSSFDFIVDESQQQDSVLPNNSAFDFIDNIDNNNSSKIADTTAFDFMNDDNNEQPKKIDPEKNDPEKIDPFSHLLNNDNNNNDNIHSHDNNHSHSFHQNAFGHSKCAVNECNRDRVAHGYCAQHAQLY